MCHVHFIRAILKKLPKKNHKETAARLKEGFEDQSKMSELITEFDSSGFRNTADTIERFQYRLHNYQAFPESNWKRIRTTNIMERTNNELKRRSKVLGAFPN